MIQDTLRELLSHLAKAKQATEPGGPYNGFTSLDEIQRKIAGNMLSFVHATASFHSSKSTSVGDTVAGIRDDSVLGTSLSREEMKQIRGWSETILEFEEDEIPQGEEAAQRLGTGW